MTIEFAEDQLNRAAFQFRSPVPAAVLDQYAEAPLAPAESPAPWRAIPSNVLGCMCLYDAKDGFIGTVTSPELAFRIVNAVNRGS